MAPVPHEDHGSVMITRSRVPAPVTSPWLTALALLFSSVLLAPLLRGTGWLLAAAAAIGLVTLTYDVLRRIGVPVALIPIGEALVLLTLLCEMTARNLMPLGMFPGPGALRGFWAGMGAGLMDAYNAMPPVATNIGIITVVTFALGWLTILAHSLAEFADPVGLGWPVLILYFAVAAIRPTPLPWPLFSVAAVGWLALLGGREQSRLRAWGHQLAAHRQLITATSRNLENQRPLPILTSSARQLGAVAIAIAVIVPILLPSGPHVRLVGGNSGRSGPDGLSGVGNSISIDPTVSLRRDLIATDNRVVLTYTVTAGSTPYVGSPDYLRMDVLESFDGTTWRSRTSDGLSDYPIDSAWPLPPGLPTTVAPLGPTYAVKLGPLDGHALPVPPLVRSLRISGAWFFDAPTQTVRTTSAKLAGLSYTASTWNSSPTPAQLRAAGPPTAADPLLDLAYPSNTPASIIALAHQVVGPANTAFDQAAAIQKWLRTFTYSTSVQSGASTNYLLSFLKDRTGYCEQFAATMALFARILGIPSRVAVGFAPGTPMLDGSWQVSVHDAHAWPELFFHGIGWIRFEPTPRASEGTGINTPAYATVAQQPEQTPSADPASVAGGKTKRLDPGDTKIVVALPTAAMSIARRLPRGLIWLLVLIFACLPNLRRVRRRVALRRGQPTDRIEAVWRDLAASGAELAGGWLPNSTPRQIGDWLRRFGNDSDYRSAVHRLINSVESSRYARPNASAKTSPPIEELRIVRRQLWRQSSWRTRIRAAMLPVRSS
ncbi:MAG: DUF3488 and transglutaminase-like domain-containing protein [Actinomycetes bacterium]